VWCFEGGPFPVAGTAGLFLSAKPEACGYPRAGEAAASEFFDADKVRTVLRALFEWKSWFSECF